MRPARRPRRKSPKGTGPPNFGPPIALGCDNAATWRRSSPLERATALRESGIPATIPVWFGILVLVIAIVLAGAVGARIGAACSSCSSMRALSRF